MTTGAFAPGDLFSGDVLPRGVAYLAIGAPTGLGDWAVRAAMSQGDLSSWIVAGSFVSKREGFTATTIRVVVPAHRNIRAGIRSRSLPSPKATAMSVRSYGLNRWTIGPGVSVEYGGRYARYDYLDSPALFSPRAGITLEPTKTTRVTAVFAQRMIAPGAEEFLAPAVTGPWLPPQRTFSPLYGDSLRVERARDLTLLVEHDFGMYSFGMRRFFQGIDNQAMTIFGMRAPDGSRSVGHYYVAGAGSVDVDGWGVHLSSNVSKRVTGSVDYSLTHGHWNSFGEISQARPWLANLTREPEEDVHDSTTSIRPRFPRPQLAC